MTRPKPVPRLSLSTLFPAAFAVAAGVLLWIAVGYAGNHGLAFAVTLLIAAFFGLGAWELWRFRRATSDLNAALQAVPDSETALADWLQALPETLRNAVRLRVAGERAGLPGPALTPYITGLLVLLGMLGTFLGMVVTLNGTVIALESTTDLQSIRASLAAPVRGLGVAFGTSVAGVAASAMLGLMSALARRERLQAGQWLDSRIAGPLRAFSQVRQRDQKHERQREQQHEALLQTLQSQAALMPALIAQVQALMAQMEGQQRQLGEQLLTGQQAFHHEAAAAYSGLGTSTQAAFGALAAAVDRSLQTSLAASAQAAGDTVSRVVEGAMGRLAHQAAALHASVASGAQQQLGDLATQFEATLRGVAAQWTAALERSTAAFESGTATLVHGVAGGQAALQAELATAAAAVARQSAALHEQLAQTAAQWHERLAQQASSGQQAAAASLEQHAAGLLLTVQAQHRSAQAEAAAGDEKRLAAWTQSLQGMASALQLEWRQAGERAQAQTTHTLAEVQQLLAAAAEAPRAAAEVIAQLRQQLSESIAHDNGLLQERGRIMATLATLLQAVEHASTEQRSAIDALVARSAAMLERVGGHFTEQVQAESERLRTAAVQITASAVEVSSLGEAFGHAVQLFSASNDRLSQQLQRIEGTLAQSVTRSDEQLAYYVAQAREIIDLSLLSQRQIVEDLQRFSKRQAVLAGEAA